MPDTLQILSSCGENESKYLSTSLSIVKTLPAKNVMDEWVWYSNTRFASHFTMQFALQFEYEERERENIASANGQHIQWRIQTR